METKVLSVQLSDALTAVGTTDAAAILEVAKTAIQVVAQHEKTIIEAVNANLSLQKKLDTLQAGGSIKPEVTVDDEVYTVEHGVKIDGKVYTAEQIAENVDIAIRLVEGNSTALAKKVTE